MTAITQVKDPFEGLDCKYPITLFPVRLETRFVRYDPPPESGSEPVGELRVRIYPDGILCETHDPLLTKAELEVGTDYWKACLNATEEDKRDAWTALIAEIGAPRAAWVVRQTKPDSALDRLGTRDPKSRPAPRAHLLPEEWLVQATCSHPREQVYHELSGPTQGDLSLALGLGAGGNKVKLSDGLEVDEAIRWTFGFDRALEVGMAVSIELMEEDFASGFSRVIVTGVKRDSLSIQQSGQALDDLFEGHHYTRGCSFVSQGTPTNNTSHTRSGYPPADPHGEESRAVELGPQWDGTDSDCDGAHFARALGLSAETLRHIAGAGGGEQKNAREMATALWPATVGYTMETMMSAEFDDREETLYDFDPLTVEATRELFVNHVRGRGPLPAFRIGDVPYGVLPVSKLPQSEEEREEIVAQVEELLLELEELDEHDSLVEWMLLPRLAGLKARLLQLCDVPNIGRRGDPDVDLYSALSMDASPRELYIRPMFGRDLIDALQQVVGNVNTAGIPPNIGYMGGAIGSYLPGDDLGRLVDLNGDPRGEPHIPGGGSGGIPITDFFRMPEDVVRALETLQGGGGVPQGARSAPGTQEAMAMALLRDWGGPILSYFGDAYRFSCGMVVIPPLEVEEDEVLSETEGLGDDNCIHALQVYTQALIDGDQSAGLPSTDDYPKTLLYLLLRQATLLTASAYEESSGDQETQEALQEHNEALLALESLPTAELERLLGETLGVCSYRIDAWITALASKRLDRMRTNIQHDSKTEFQFDERNCHIAAYGWVENLKPIRHEERTPVEGMEGVTALTYSSGYIYAPSPAHGSAAAVLRNAYMTRKGEAEQKPYEIDLSSARVRTALWLLGAVREGQPLGAALGYLFERGLHDAGLDSHIDDIRNDFPLVANKMTSSKERAEQVAARNVVDGYALLTQWRNKKYPTKEEVTVQIRVLDEAMDAITDLLTAESVYQWIKGGVGGAGATLDAIAKGSRPPEPEITSVPLGGTSLVHRVGPVLGEPTAMGVWGSKPRNPRGRAEPYLNAWAGSILGDPKQVKCRVHLADEKPWIITLDHLGLDPLDLLALARAVESDSLDSELDRRVFTAALTVQGGGSQTSPPAMTRIEYHLSNLLTTERSFAEILEIARALNRVLATARPLWPVDLEPSERATSASVQQAERLAAADLKERGGTLLKELKELIEDLAAIHLSGLIDKLPEMLHKASLFGLVSAFSAPGVGEEKETLIRTTDSVLEELQQRQAAAYAQKSDPVKLFQAVLGRDFTVVPRFVPAALPEFGKALEEEPILGDDPEAAVSAWMAQAARVRKPLGEWRKLMLYAGTLGSPPSTLRVLQLPFRHNNPWVALEFDSPKKRPPAGQLSLVLHSPELPVAKEPWAGLLVDEWVELIPNAEEDAGIVFHYDSPGTEAPHAVLIAVPPDGTESWDGGTLLEILEQTFDLARVRGSDGEYYTSGIEDDATQQDLYSGNALFGLPIPFLPMICIAENAEGNQISPTFEDCLENDDSTAAEGE
ncbi:MAG: hypothetical protein DIZ77_16730 [endosymbiont of Seepiophila jonesi]|uniref:Uncharacterized protein n=1 Tax=endosymbiont of Lamellibrachia luymesi TaxID=2200907 RepID=A0A370E166_9GAMM|nr:MAG: hypothetical protein DIZ77_16730 [endosymbiont of Seepiophila jonesi]RDH91950.1 MAG: hypothetical protein DIZ79_04790 [endosymbiont of Lamellibrachia luymesi]